MATTILLTCDIHDDGATPAMKTVEIAVGRRRWRVDLCADHEAALVKAVEPFAAKSAKAAKAANAPRAKRGVQTSDAGQVRRSAVRAWASSVGKNVSDRGRIAQSVYDEYDAALAKKASRKRR